MYSIRISTSKMLSLGLFVFGITFSILQIAFAQVELGHVELGCPVGSYRHGNFCYVVSDDDAVTHDEAKSRCNANGGSLAIIKDYETHVFLHRLRMRNFLHCYWFGLHDKRGEGIWNYEDGTKLTGYTNWGVGEPNNNGGVQDCASLLIHQNLTWDDEFCYMNFLYICEFPETNCTSKSNILGKTCYEPSHHFAPYNEASKRCKTRGGQLALIKTQESDAFIRSLIYNDTFWLTMSEEEIKDVYAGLALKFTWVRGSWIGLQFRNSTWLYDNDNSTSNFTRWSNNELRSSKTRCATLGKAMDPYFCGISYAYGKTYYTHNEIEDCYNYAKNWNPEECSERNSYICQYSAEISISGPTVGQNVDNVQTTPDSLMVENTKSALIEGQNADDVQSNADNKNDATDNKQTEKHAALEGDGNKQGGIHLGVVPFILLIVSCFLTGVLMTIVIYGAYIMKRNIGIRMVGSTRNLIGSTETDPY